jgi:CBS domain-containing protein
MKYFRELLGLIVILVSVIALVAVGYKIVSTGKTTEDYQFVYSSLLPLVGTWVGVVLAFYFGKENYEAASKHYENIIEKLTPEILDDIHVYQIMIARKTMIAKKWNDIENKTVKEVIDFLIEVDKSRLPVVDANGKIKYIIHSSLLSMPTKDITNQIQPANPSEKMSDFVKRYLGVIDQIVLVKEDEILENVRKTISSKPNCEDVFIEDANGILVGWLTNTLILRYINSKKA